VCGVGHVSVVPVRVLVTYIDTRHAYHKHIR
jgi:hypothetical protein